MSVSLRYVWITCLLAVMGFTATAAPLGTGFTYQGRLDSSGGPVNGTANLRFSLWDAAGTGNPPVGGNQIGASQLLANVPVANGLFVVLLNDGGQFGANAFSGDARWLQIEVCADTGCGSLTILSPRQAVTASPYTLGPWVRSASGSLSYMTGNVGIGTATPTSALDVRGPLTIVNGGDQADVLWMGIERSWVFRQEGTGSGTALKLESVGGGGNKNFVVQTTGALVASNIVTDNFETGVANVNNRLTSPRTGPIKNLLPIAMAWVQASGSKSAGTDNVTTSWVTDHFVVEIGESVQGSQPIITPLSSSARSATALYATPTSYNVYIHDANGNKVQNAFYFVAFKP